MKRFLLLFAILLTITQIRAQKVYEWYQDGVLIFQLKPESKYQIRSNEYAVDLDEVSFIHEMRAKYDITKMSRILYYHPDEKLRNTYQIDFNKAELIEEFIKDVAKHSFVEYAEKKELHVKFLTPNDLGVNSTTGTGMWHLYTMQAELAWNLSTGSSTVVVAVTDDAIKTTHPDLVGKFVAGNDASDQNSTDPNPCGANDGNHGTHVAGTVGANTNNGTGIASIGFDVSIMPVKIGRCSDGALTAGFEGLAWAANNGADVINMSWGGGGSSTFGQNTVNAAFNQGAILVAAAGNDGTTSFLYPAAYNNVIAVASTTINDTKSSFSQFGTWIDISAPGSAIRSTVATGNSYDRYNGTSMASPNVSGLLGLMKSYAPNASRTDLINCLYSSADPVSGNVGQMGAGRINAFAALNCVSAFTLQTDAGITNIASPTNTICGNSFTPEITLRNFGSNTITNLVINYTWGAVNNNFNWSGNLTSGQSVVVNLPVQTAAGSGNFTFTATANLNGDQLASNNSDSKTFTIDPNGQIATLTLTTDCYGSETTWEILDDLNNVVVSGGPYTNVNGGQTLTSANCLPVGCYTFVINDSYGDGLHGSQWNTCSVDGDYALVGANGANLVQMTAVDGDFGNTTSHSFCIIDPNLNDDAGITEIVFPKSIICSGTFAPQVRIRNFGNNNLTSATINYNTGGANQTFNWTGNLSTGQTAIVTLPAINTGTGFTTLTAGTVNPNGNADQNNANNQSQGNFNVFSSSLSLPYTESFNTNSFTNGTWSLDNPDNSTTWELVPVSGTTPGTTGAKMDFFNYAQSAQRDGLISPSLNFIGYSSITMTFEHAYRRFNQSTTDSLIIYVSTNCGSTWQRVFGAGEDATGSFATAATNTNAFTPANTNEWCMGTVGSSCFSVNLTPFAGNEVLIKFEGYNSGTIGNNLYLDNINITGVGAPITANFNANTTTVCEGETVTFNDLSSGVVNSRTWNFVGGTPSTSTAASPTISYNTAGTYNVSYTVNGPSGTDTETKTAYITVSDAPNASITGNNTFCVNGSAALTANASAGSGTITSFEWFRNGVSVGSGPTYTATLAGNYTLEVTNSNNCSFTTPVFTVSVSSSPVATITGSNNFCQGSSTVLTANASTPSGSISSYIWQNGSAAIAGSNSPTLTVSQAGNYSVIVTNSFGCSSTSNSIAVGSPIALPTVSITGSNIVCPNGSVSLAANTIPGAGTTVSSYQWFRNGSAVGSNSGILNTAQGGMYTVLVTNSAGCSSSSPTFTLTEASSFIVAITTTDAGCGVSDGSASLTVNGGTTGYSFAWNNSAPSNVPNVANLSAGIYTVDVIDNATGCVQVESFQIENAGAPTIDSAAIVQATCTNGGVGSASIYVSGGSGNYTFNWGPGFSNTSSQSNLNPGTYIVEVTDAALCQATFSFTINNSAPPSVDTAIVTNATCLGVNNGAVNLQVSGGSGSYSFSWSNGNSSQNLFNIAAGSYTVTITDQNNGCITNETVVIGNSYSIGNNLNILDNSASQGVSSISATATGGVPPYLYSWNNGTLSGDFINNLSGGQYILEISDNNGCLAFDTASIGFVSIRGIDLISSLNIYPNPAQEMINLDINLKSNEDVSISIVNVLGQELWSNELKDYKQGVQNISTAAIAAGTYFVKIRIRNQLEIIPFNKIN